jgi:hypothetical protein
LEQRCRRLGKNCLGVFIELNLYVTETEAIYLRPLSFSQSNND